MKLKNLPAAAAITAAAVSLAAAGAHASIVINFDTLTAGATVDSYYAGGTDSLGETGPSDGVTFTPGDWAVLTGFGETSQPNFAYSKSGAGAVDVSGGFTSLSFTFGDFVPSTVSVYSGLDGTGTLLGSASGISASPYAFGSGSVSFAGVAHSIVISSGAVQFGWDDVTLGAGVPEPGAWTLMLVGFAGLGVAARSRRRALA